jgi:hypothetical protein
MNHHESTSGMTDLLGDPLSQPMVEPTGGLPPEAAPVVAASAAAALGAKARKHPFTLGSVLLAVLSLGLVLVLRRRSGSTAHALLDPQVPPMR